MLSIFLQNCPINVEGVVFDARTGAIFHEISTTRQHNIVPEATSSPIYMRRREMFMWKNVQVLLSKRYGLRATVQHRFYTGFSH